MFPLETDSTRAVAACSLILAGGTLTTVFDAGLDPIKNGVTKGSGERDEAVHKVPNSDADNLHSELEVDVYVYCAAVTRPVERCY